MSDEKTDGIVIRTVEFSETSSVVTFFTRDHGKISALAKGARRRKGPFESALDLLATCRIVFLHKHGDSLDLLTEAKMQYRLRIPGKDVSRLYASYHIADLLHQLTDEGDPHPELYDATFQCLRTIENPNLPYQPGILRYELQLLHEIGQLPSMRKCVGCGKTELTGERVSFGLLAGGVMCPTCRIGQRKLVSVRRPVLELLKQFSDPLSDSWRSNTKYHEYEKEIRPLVNNLFAGLLGRRPKLFGFIPILGKT